MSALEAAYAHCSALTRLHDKDRWLASLYAPASARPPLHALLAFNYEVARLREILREPLAGQMRLTWWREAIEGERSAEAQAHPVAMALGDAIQRHALPRQFFVNLLQARVFDLYDDPMPTQHDFEAYCGETCSSLFQMAALVLGAGDAALSAEAAGHAGVAYALTGLMGALPLTSARGQCFLPRDILEKFGAGADDVAARRDSPALRAALGALRALVADHLRSAQAAAGALAATLAPAFLPLALTRLYLSALERSAASPFAHLPEPPIWRKQWALWRAARVDPR